jgi:hypothetical protein
MSHYGARLMNEQVAPLSTTEGYVFRRCNVDPVHRSPWCEGGELEALAGDLASPLNISLAAILSRPLACSKCAALLLMRRRP